MTLFLNLFVGFAMFFLLGLYLCTATLQSAMTTFTVKKCVATSHTTVQMISNIQCVEKCNKERQTGGCTLAGYNKATKTCYLSVDDPNDVMDTADEMAGVFFFDSDPTGMYCMIYVKCMMS